MHWALPPQEAKGQGEWLGVGWHGPQGMWPDAEERLGQAALKRERLVGCRKRVSQPAGH